MPYKLILIVAILSIALGAVLGLCLRIEDTTPYLGPLLIATVATSVPFLNDAIAEFKERKKAKEYNKQALMAVIKELETSLKLAKETLVYIEARIDQGNYVAGTIEFKVYRSFYNAIASKPELLDPNILKAMIEYYPDIYRLTQNLTQALQGENQVQVYSTCEATAAHIADFASALISLHEEKENKSADQLLTDIGFVNIERMRSHNI